MAISKSLNAKKKLSYISVPSQIISSLSSSQLQSLLISHEKAPKSPTKLIYGFNFSLKNPRVWLFAVFLLTLLGMLKSGFNLDPYEPFSPNPCLTSQSEPSSTKTFGKSENSLSLGGFSKSRSEKDETLMSSDVQSQPMVSKGNEEESEFWKQPDGMGFKPCLEFSNAYKRESNGQNQIDKSKSKTRYLLVVVSGGLNQQRNQIVDAVVIARILGAALVVPILQVNVIWGDESEFSDIFDLQHFKTSLVDDVRVVSSLPSTHVMTRLVEEKKTPLRVSPQWIRSHYLKRFNKDGVLLLRGLDSRLSLDLPSDLQKLRCKVAFHALRFAPSILRLGNELAGRMRSKGPYLALHLRMEKDVWVRTGCLPELTPEFDEIVYNERKRHPELLTARSNMTYHQRKLAGLCPLTAIEVTRLLKALGAQENTRIYWAGGEPLGGKEALSPLTSEFHNFYNKYDIALPGELELFANRASVMAAIDYIVSEKSDVFMASHGGNMGHAIQGHRAYAGHNKYITPNKRHMLPHFLNSSLPESEFNKIIKDLHQESLGQPDFRISKAKRDVTKYPAPDCMCSDSLRRHT